MKTLLLVLVSAYTLFTGAALMQPNQPKTTQDKTRPFMRAKLVGSQSVLDGLVTENFGLIHRGAADMKALSEAVQWPRSEDEVYDHYGDEFRRQCAKLMKLAEQKNLEGAHFTYLSMTTTCINCHNYVRGHFKVEQNRENPQGPVRLIPSDWERQTFKQDRSTDAHSGQFK